MSTARNAVLFDLFHSKLPSESWMSVVAVEEVRKLKNLGHYLQRQAKRTISTENFSKFERYPDLKTEE